MSNEEIVLISIVFATIVMCIYFALKNGFYKYQYNKGVNRVNRIKQLLKDDVIGLTLVNIDEEPDRIKRPDDNNGLIIDGEKYDEKNSYFLEEGKTMYVVGKKKDYIIALVGGYIGRR